MLAGVKKSRRDSPITGMWAGWYARLTKRDMAEFRSLAMRLADQLPPGSHVLELGFGPGYWAIELAKLGNYRIKGLDLSADFVQIADRNARQAGVDVDFYEGNAARMPFESDSFDFLLCRAAFKNFADPLAALDEMHRVLRPGGRALIIDLRSDASLDDIRSHVDGMNLGLINSTITKFIFKHSLLKRAYSQEDFARLARDSRFGTCTIVQEAIGLDVWLNKPVV